MTESTHCFQKWDSNSGCRCSYDGLLKIVSRLLCTDLHPPSGADEVCGHGSSKIYTHHHQELMKFEGKLKVTATHDKGDGHYFVNDLALNSVVTSWNNNRQIPRWNLLPIVNHYT
jgi:hypothetical protein